MKKGNKRARLERFPYEPTPMAQDPGSLDGCLEQVNRFGTFNVQATNDTDNVFPAIAQGLPKDIDPNIFSLKPKLPD